MKTLLILVVFISSPFLSIGQTFNWTDTSFTPGSKRVIMPYWSMKNEGRLQDDDTTRKIMDTLIRFLRKNPSVKIKAACYLAGRPLSGLKRLSQTRANYLRLYLYDRGRIDTSRILAKGYEFTHPIVPQDTLNSLFGKQELTVLNRYEHINERTEITILNK